MQRMLRVSVTILSLRYRDSEILREFAILKRNQRQCWVGSMATSSFVGPVRAGIKPTGAPERYTENSISESDLRRRRNIRVTEPIRMGTQ